METKQCTRCGATKPISEFHKSPTSRDKLQSRCKPCQNELALEYKRKNPEKVRRAHQEWSAKNREHLNKRQREWHRKNPGKGSDYELKQNYGLPVGSYDKMLAAQNGRCAICKTDKPNGKGRFHLDHCHDTGTIRGLLCSSCNLAIGHLKHSEEILQAAINYLRSPYP